MKRHHATFFVQTAVLLATSVALQAHPGHEGDHDLTWSFTGGLLHPLGGLDHLLAMLAVGFWASRREGNSHWLLPLTFLATMALGAALNLGHGVLPAVEQGVAASLLVFGLLVAATKNVPTALGVAITAIFALLHGLAHGGEASSAQGFWAYGGGFLISTALLLLAGFGLGATKAGANQKVRRTAGALVGLAGAALLAL